MQNDSLAQVERDLLTGILELALQDPRRGREVSRKLRAEMFTEQDAADTFRLAAGVLSVHEQPTAGDMTAHDAWPRCRELVLELLDTARANLCAYSLGAERFAHKVRSEWTKRAARDAADDLKALIDDGASPAEVIAAADAVKDAAASIETDTRPVSLMDAVHEYLLMEASPVIPTQFRPVDALASGGLPVGGLTILAAPPSVGKSALALQLTLGALEQDRELRAVWCLGEMTLEAFARRVVCHWSTRGSQAPVSMSSAEQRTDLARGTAGNVVLNIGDRLRLVRPPLTMERIEAEVIQAKARLVVVDYVQLVEIEDAQDRRAEVDGVVKRLRRLSLQHDVAILAVSNVAKVVSAETRIGAIGKESSELDFACDIMLLGVADEQDDQNGLRSVTWACKKNRHGQRADIATTFDGRLQTFTDAMAGRDPDLDSWG